jgi:hypothetical protein
VFRKAGARISMVQGTLRVAGIAVTLFSFAPANGCGSIDTAVPGAPDAAQGDDRDAAPTAVETADGADEADAADGGAVDPNDAANDVLVTIDATPNDAAPHCPTRTTIEASARAAKSAGFTGTETGYYALYNVMCQAPSDCTTACVTAGGTMESCSTGSDCLAGGPGGAQQCLPPTYWRSVSSALSESAMTTNAAELTLVMIDYRDALVATDFGIDVPDGATILGVQFRVRRNADDGFAVDDAIRVMKDGLPVGTDHHQSASWPKTLAYTTYGGPADSWDVDWQPADFSSTGFGISIAPRYTSPTDGNDRAHIESVRATVFYTDSCN